MDIHPYYGQTFFFLINMVDLQLLLIIELEYPISGLTEQTTK